MKNVFGIDVTQDRKNTQIDGLVFLQRSAPQAEQDALDRYSARLNEIQKRRLLPAPLRVFQWLLGLILLCVVYGVIEGLAEISATAERPSLLLPFCLLAVPALLWLLLFLAARRRKKRVDCQEETQQIFRQSETLLRNAYDALGVPRDALALDVLKFRYRRGKKRLKPRGPRLSEMLTKAAKPADYLNVERQAYIADGCLCLADPYQVLAIPLEEIQGICLLKKPLQLPRWNKAVHYTQPPYGAYQIKSIGFGLLQVPNAYQLTIRHSGETYQLLVPAYEQAVLKRLLPAAFQA